MERLDGVREYDRIRRFLSRIYLYVFLVGRIFLKVVVLEARKIMIIQQN